MTAIIEVRKLTKRFGEHTAVNGVSFEVERGEVFGLLGPNGAGKSTTIKMLTTLLPPTSGDASVNGFDILRQKADVRRSIGYVPQALIIYILAAILGVKLNFNPLALLSVIIIVVLGAACFSTFSMIIACILKTRDRVMGIGQIMTMPMFFASNAIYPITIMPGWLQVIAHINPLTYVVDGVRSTMLAGGTSAFGLGTDIGVLFAIVVVLALICARLYPRIIQ